MNNETKKTRYNSRSLYNIWTFVFAVLYIRYSCQSLVLLDHSYAIIAPFSFQDTEENRTNVLPRYRFDTHAKIAIFLSVWCNREISQKWSFYPCILEMCHFIFLRVQFLNVSIHYYVCYVTQIRRFLLFIIIPLSLYILHSYFFSCIFLYLFLLLFNYFHSLSLNFKM